MFMTIKTKIQNYSAFIAGQVAKHKRSVPAQIIYLLYIVAVVCLAFAGLYSFGGFTAIVAYILLFSTFTYNYTVYTVIRNKKLQTRLAVCIGILSIAYYFFG